MTASVPDIRTWLWQRMLTLDKQAGQFTMADLKRKGMGWETARGYVRELVEAGYVEAMEGDHPRARKHYRLLRHQKIAPLPRGSSARQQLMWNAMRRLSSFDVNELAAVASTDEISITRGSAYRYVNRLHRAGFLALVRPAGRGRRARWRLVRDTGPFAPQGRRRGLYDPNTGELHQLSP